MDKEIYKFNVCRSLDEYEYLDEKLFLEKINYFIRKKLIFNPSFETYSGKFHNGKQYFEYLLDFIIYNKEQSLILIDRILKDDRVDSKSCSLLKEYIETISKLELKNNIKFYSMLQWNKVIGFEEAFEEACDILLKFTIDFEFPMEIDLNNIEIITLVLSKIKSTASGKKFNDNNKYWIDFNTIRTLVILYDYILNRYQKSRIKVADEDEFVDYVIKVRSDLLCDELYSFLYDSLKELKTVHSSNLDYDFLDIINECVRFLLRDCNFIKLDKKQKKRLLKFYYLTIFYGNYVGNTIDLTNSHSGIGNYTVYNIFSGFKSNVEIIKRNIITDLNNYSHEIDYDGYFKGDNLLSELLNNTIFKNSLLESAYYQKALLDYSPIFKEMEYTPILVNLFKTVEEISCDLFEILGLDKTLVNINKNEYIRCCYFEDEPVFFNDVGWKDKIMLGGIEKLIYSINTKEFPMYLNNKDISAYHTAYDEFEYYSEEPKWQSLLSTSVEEFNEKYSKDFDCELMDKTEKINNSEILRNNFKLWIDKCRNGTLHKHNVFESKRADFCFDFTLYIINLLVEWCYILKKSIK